MARLTRELQTVESTGENDRDHHDYWEQFYAGTAVSAVPHEPSPFARWVAERESAPGPLVDIGTGNGRDALWFARQGFQTLGMDYADSALHLATEAASADALPASFAHLNLYHADEVAASARQAADVLSPTVVYARFLIHAIEDEGRRSLWAFAAAALHEGGRAYLEFRTAETHHVFGEHYRQFVEPALVVAELEATGARIEHIEEGFGMAVYKTEDPRVCRIVARW